MAVTVYKKTALTGGGAGALDAVDGDDLLDGDLAFSMASSVLYIHILDDNSAAAESIPYVIAPDTNPGDKRWILQSMGATLATASNNATAAAKGVMLGSFYRTNADPSVVCIRSV